MSSDVMDRYGAPAPWRRRALITGCVVLAGAFLGWLAWAVWAQSTPEVQSHLVGYHVVDEHQVSAVVDVDLSSDDVTASCTLRAYAVDHTVVGELTFEPDASGRSEQSLRTERRATSVDLVGCTAPDQSRPR